MFVGIEFGGRVFLRDVSAELAFAHLRSSQLEAKLLYFPKQVFFGIGFEPATRVPFLGKGFEAIVLLFELNNTTVLVEEP